MPICRPGLSPVSADTGRDSEALAGKISHKEAEGIILGTDTEFLKYKEFGVCPQNYS